MSRGYGRIQRRILEILTRQQGRKLSTTALAFLVSASDSERPELEKMRPKDLHIHGGMTLLGPRLVTNGCRNAVSRACHRLWQEGKIDSYRATTRGDYKGSTVWAIKG